MQGDGRVKDFPGNYSDYRRYVRDLARRESATAPAAATPAQKPKTQRKEKLNFRERREFEALDAEIAVLTAEKEELAQKFSSGEPLGDIAARSARFAEVQELLDEKEMRWLELSEKA